MFVAPLAANQAFGDVWLSVVLCYFGFQAAFSIPLRQPENLIHAIKTVDVISNVFRLPLPMLRQPENRIHALINQNVCRSTALKLRGVP